MLAVLITAGRLVTVTARRHTPNAAARVSLDAALMALAALVLTVHVLAHGELRLGGLTLTMHSLYTPVFLFTLLALRVALIGFRPRVSWRAPVAAGHLALAGVAGARHRRVSARARTAGARGAHRRRPHGLRARPLAIECARHGSAVVLSAQSEPSARPRGHRQLAHPPARQLRGERRVILDRRHRDHRRLVATGALPAEPACGRRSRWVHVARARAVPADRGRAHVRADAVDAASLCAARRRGAHATAIRRRRDSRFHGRVRLGARRPRDAVSGRPPAHPHRRRAWRWRSNCFPRRAGSIRRPCRRSTRRSPPTRGPSACSSCRSAYATACPRSAISRPPRSSTRRCTARRSSAATCRAWKPRPKPPCSACRFRPRS